MRKRNLILVLLITLSAMACKNSQYPDLKDGLYAEFDTNYGKFLAQLYYKKAPLTVANFVSLAEGTNTLVDEKYKGKKYFDGLTFHRIVRGFVIQGGDPLGNSQGGPGYEFPNETNTGLKHDSKGILSMANSGPDTNGSQFFITLNATPNLDGGYSVFGKVIKNIEVVDSIGNVEVNRMDKPLKDVVMNQVKIIRVGEGAQNFDAAKVFADKMGAAVKAEEEAKAKIKAQLDSLSEGFTETESGLRYKITKSVESGATPQPGQTVQVYYKGMLIDGQVFDKRLEEDGQKPISFQVGTGRVIAGWDEGLQLLKEGEEARFIIPPHLGYGQRGIGPIPANSYLIFDVKLAKIGK